MYSIQKWKRTTVGVDGSRVWTWRRMGMDGRRTESESAARTRYMCMEGGERIDSSVKNYLRKVMDKRWMGLGTRTQWSLYVHWWPIAGSYWFNKLFQSKQCTCCRSRFPPPEGLGQLFLEKPLLFLRHCQPYSHTSWSPDKNPQALQRLGDATLDRTSKGKKCQLPPHLKSSPLIIIIPESHGCCFPCPGVTKPRPQHGHLGQLHKEHTVGRSP